ncbi:hypothetical protein EZS27_002107 [termite gut metagenome]|uniref:Uncharacterized protein n=1 Tax=termite gut metagenome TaxID=433724 RepID=A0A5J4SZ42_9ZZZZ
MKLNKESQLLIETAIYKAVSKYKGDCERTEITDIHIQVIQNSGELFIFDDDDRELANTVIDEWVTYDGKNFYESIERILRSLLTKMKEAGRFENLAILTPYSFVLIDEDKETLAELILIDDDIVLLSDELLKGMDKELDTFLDKLLKD